MFIRILIGMIKIIRLSLTPFQETHTEAVETRKRSLIVSQLDNLQITIGEPHGSYTKGNQINNNGLIINTAD